MKINKAVIEKLFTDFKSKHDTFTLAPGQMNKQPPWRTLPDGEIELSPGFIESIKKMNEMIDEEFCRVMIRKVDRDRLLEALESHAYWQISEEQYRDNGFVHEPGADDPEIVEELRELDRLSIALGGEAITFTGEAADKEAAPEEGDEVETVCYARLCAERATFTRFTEGKIVGHFCEKHRNGADISGEAVDAFAEAVRASPPIGDDLVCAIPGCAEHALHSRVSTEDDNTIHLCLGHAEWHDALKGAPGLRHNHNKKEAPPMNETMCQRDNCYTDPHRATECEWKHPLNDKHKAQPALEPCKEHAFSLDAGFKVCNACGHTEPFPNTREGLIRFIQAQCDKMVTTAREKNTDYAGAGSDPFANFSRVEALGICKVEVGFLTRMTDKMSRINSFVQAGTLAVKDESVQDTLRDLANYSLLMLAYIESKKAGV